MIHLSLPAIAECSMQNTLKRKVCLGEIEYNNDNAVITTGLSLDSQ